MIAKGSILAILTPLRSFNPGALTGQKCSIKTLLCTSSSIVQQMLGLAEKLDSADKRVKSASVRLRDYQNDPSLDSSKKEIGEITTKLEQAKKELAVFDGQILHRIFGGYFKPRTF